MKKTIAAAAVLVAAFALFRAPEDPETVLDEKGEAAVSRRFELAKVEDPRSARGSAPARREREPAAEAARPGAAALKLIAPVETRLAQRQVNDDPGPGEEVLRYDGRSGRLSPNARPDGTEVTTKVASAGPAPALVVWVPSIRVQAGAEVVIHAAIVDRDGAPVAPASIVAAVARHGSPAGPELSMQPVEAQDHQFELRLRAPAEAGTFDYVVLARGALEGEPFERAAAGAFHVNAAGARIEAKDARVERRAGDLALTVPAYIDRPGTYWMYAELWGGEDGTRPIAFARQRFEGMATGARPLTVSFGGAIIRHSGIDGPYVVRNVRFQQVGSFPPQEQEPIAVLGPTQAWRANDFD
jgi:hypothetical protein